ncbi:hypothetical protein WA158_002794 [Blastocystis sp. Blastoise]
MGGGAKTTGKHQAHAKKRYYKRLRAVSNRFKDLDQIQDELKNPKKAQTTYNEELPGGGLFYCLYCDRHMPDQKTLDEHQKCKIHQKNVKKANQEQYTQEEAELAAGKSKEVYEKIVRN